MAQAEGIATGTQSAASGGEPMPATSTLQTTPSEAITAAATEVVAGALTTAHGRCSNPGAMEELTLAAAASATVMERLPATADADDSRDGALTDRQAGASPRPMKPGGDLRGSFLAAVGNTISQAEPLGVPKINPDDSSSSSGEESEPPVQLPRRSRRASSITRAGNAALSLSSSIPTASAAGPLLLEGASSQAHQHQGKARRLASEEMNESVRSLLVAAPAYPDGVGGRLAVGPSSSVAEPPTNPGSDAAGRSKRRTYSMVFDGEGLAAGDSARKAARERGLPFGLEAVPDESDPTLLCVREVSSGGAGAAGDVVARVKATPTVAGGREAVYSVFLGGGKGEGVEGELMAIRVSTHPTRLAAPREVQAVLLLGQEGEAVGGKLHERGTCGVLVWDSATANRADGLWEAAVAGRAGEAAVKLQSKAATWSSTTESFELDLLEAWRPGRLSARTPTRTESASAAAAAATSSQPAPETVQMVAARDGNQSSRSGSSSARNGGSGSRRIPSMQLARVTDTGSGPTAGSSGGGSKGDATGGGKTGAGKEEGGFSWEVAVAAPIPPLYGFCLAVVGLETEMVGAAVKLVDRSAEVVEKEAAVGFEGFDKALTQDSKGAVLAPGATPPASARPKEKQQQHQAEGNDESSVPSVPALALGVVASAGAQQAARSGGPPSSGSGSRRPSSRRSGAGGDGDRNGNNNNNNSKSNNNNNEPNSVLQKPIIGQDADAAGQQLAGRGKNDGGRGVTVGVRTEGQPAPAAAAAATGRTVPVPVKRRMSVQVAAAVIVDKVYRNTYVCNLCLLTLAVSFMADLYPGAPSHNVPISTALLWACSNVDGVRALRRRSFAYALSIAVLVSLFMDVDFLASDLKAYALSQLEEEDDDLQRVIVEKNMHTFGRIVVGIAAGLKALSWQGLLATFPQGVHALNLLWRRFKLFLPVWGSPRKLTKEVYNRVVALAWLHLLAAMALAVMAGVAGMGFEWAPQFASSQGAGIPLAAICFLKARHEGAGGRRTLSLTDLLVSAALFRNMDLALCLNVFGCLACFQGWHQAREERRRARHGVTYPKVVLEWDYIMLCGYVKIFDLLVGLWLWIGLGWSWSEDRDYSERHSIRMLLVAITTVQTLTDVWSVFLGITVSLLVSQYLLRKEKSADAARNAFGDGQGGDKDVEIARSLSTGRLLASPPMSSEEASSADEGGGRRGRRDDTESSDDSYSTGESDTDSDSDDEAFLETRGTVSGVDIKLGNAAAQPASSFLLGTATATTPGDGSAIVMTQPTQGAPWPPSNDGPRAAPRRRSMFAPGGNRLVYKRAFSARSSSDDSTIGGENTGDGGGPPPPDAVTLDRSFASTAEEFGSAWDALRTCASFRQDLRQNKAAGGGGVGELAEVETLAGHLRGQGFVVVASGPVADGRTKIYACARGIGVEALFFAELVFEKEMHELAFTFKCQDERLTSRFVCHMHLRRVIGDHQPIA
ncbi:unnamed protein product [Ectocarpus fasciculatus]